MRRDDPTPSTLFLFWPWSEPPTEVEVVLALEGFFQQERPDRADDSSPPTVVHESTDFEASGGILWATSLRIPWSDTPLLVWASPIDRSPSTQDMQGLHWSGEERRAALGTHWVVGVEMVFDTRRALRSYHRQLRICRALCEDSPALYDSASHTLRSGSQMEQLTSTRIPPRTAELFGVHATCSQRSETCWVYTQGLARAGFPEVEIADIQEQQFPAASYLIHNFIDRYLDCELPPTGKPCEVGFSLNVTWRDWEDCLDDLPRDALEVLEERSTVAGSGELEAGDGDELEPDSARRILLVDTRPRGWLRKRWKAPVEALRQIEENGTVACVSHAETERMARLARERWANFGMLYVRHREVKEWIFLVKLGYRVDAGAEDEREHLWFEVSELVPHAIQGRLLNCPLRIARLQQKDEDWHALELLTDWKIYSPLGEFTPENVGQLERVISQGRLVVS